MKLRIQQVRAEHEMMDVASMGYGTHKVVTGPSRFKIEGELFGTTEEFRRLQDAISGFGSPGELEVLLPGAVGVAAAASPIDEAIYRKMAERYKRDSEPKPSSAIPTAEHAGSW